MREVSETGDDSIFARQGFEANITKSISTNIVVLFANSQRYLIIW